MPKVTERTSEIRTEKGDWIATKRWLVRALVRAEPFGGEDIIHAY